MLKTGEKRIKLLVIILSILLALSVSALAAVLIYNGIKDKSGTNVRIPDNYITPEQSGNMPENEAEPETEKQEPEKALSMTLHNKNPEDNQPFKAENLFPGDSVTKYFCIKVAHKGDITVRFRADVQRGGEKLAEVLMCRVKLMNENEILYEGSVGAMPESIGKRLETSAPTENELYYELTFYLDTSVGNEYQNKTLKADLVWWVEEKDNLDDNPTTGDDVMIPAVACITSGALLIFLVLYRRRRRDTDE